ncbi:hypothetical protein NERG_00866 [Nematocida ausubeli]|uniref:Uncharacterized protein n=1 Tax=Nematocida ausubeli (strain ATCC PRA-371 / ERTm2) TaxID=1913371 RepID=H8ZBB7_NEMA1|nr:hypothetical protein NERG_00866 [Nematocida ausubeli]
MSIYTTNTKISIDLLKSANGTSEVPDRSNEAADSPEEPKTKGEIFHDCIFISAYIIYLFIQYIVFSSALICLIFLCRLLINSTKETFCSVNANISALLLITVELVGAFISWYFINRYNPRVKNAQVRFNFMPIVVGLLTLAILTILAISIVPFLELSTVDSILEFYNYLLYPIGLGFLYWEIIRIGILTFSFPFIYKKEIRGEKYGLFHFCKTMIIVWVFIGVLAYNLIILWNTYGQSCSILDLKYFITPQCKFYHVQ